MLVGICGVLLINVAIKVSGPATPLAMVSHFGGNIGDVGHRRRHRSLARDSADAGLGVFRAGGSGSIR
jgi:hypothetical protein